ncbi:tail fiber protein [Echinicola jeungdonensis]|uniref:Phage tail protein n=1 Tax=Echinicola jeungdonensis TaxID=709343 RepID=A0ABV5J0G1_9BACT|nr:tail fiber protein [Echinicola jeungdonensis]MDN3671082.1 tail fiber protein [Echinicola jeungdonensis]
MEEFIGVIKLFAGNFAPRGWAFCEGQLMSISQNTALFSILGTTYGGDGRTTFALPDLRGRVPIGPGRGPGLSDYREGAKGGSETNTLTILNMPAHNHAAVVNEFRANIMASNQEGTEETPGTNGAATLAASTNGGRGIDIYNSDAPNVALNTGTDGSANVTIGNTGGSQPINNVQPYTAINYIICMQGIFPPRG